MLRPMMLTTHMISPVFRNSRIWICMKERFVVSMVVCLDCKVLRAWNVLEIRSLMLIMEVAEINFIMKEITYS